MKQIYHRLSISTIISNLVVSPSLATAQIIPDATLPVNSILNQTENF